MPAPLPPGPDQLAGQRPPSPPTILLADDEAHITCVVAQKLRSAGFLVVTARDGEEAYETACKLLPALVITDLQMPRMSGLDLALKLRETASTSTTPVMMLTARGYIIDPAEAERTNIRHVMGKPFSAREVVRKVVEILGEPQGDEASSGKLAGTARSAHPRGGPSSPHAEAA